MIMEPSGELEEIVFYDDSDSTTPRALRGTMSKSNRGTNTAGGNRAGDKTSTNLINSVAKKQHAHFVIYGG
jgi:UDP-N-acetylmuramoylalanine-D-glutamate ligase